MTEDNVVSFTHAKQKKDDHNLDELEVAKRFTRGVVKPNSLVYQVKKQLKARDIKYRVSFPSLDLTGFDKKSVVIFPEVKLILEFVSKRNTVKQVEGWIVEQIICSVKEQPLDCVTFIINKISEVKNNGPTTTTI